MKPNSTVRFQKGVIMNATQDALYRVHQLQAERLGEAAQLWRRETGRGGR
jgi:hypothetical protein